MEKNSLGNIHSGPKLSISQNFIRDRRLVVALLDLVNIKTTDLVLEIGPGAGIITKELARRAGSVIAIEKDENLAHRLNRTFVDIYPNVQIINADFLSWQVIRRQHIVVSNIPFNLTANILNKLLIEDSYMNAAYLIVQEEAAGKFVGLPQATLASMITKIDFEAEILQKIDHRAFVPVPRVNAAFVSFRRRSTPVIEDCDRKLFIDFVTYGYTHARWGAEALAAFEKVFNRETRKRLGKILAISDLNVTELGINNWAELFNAFQHEVPNDKKSIIKGSAEKLHREQEGLVKIHRTRSF